MMTVPRAEWRRPAVLAAVVLASCAYFYEGGGWNQNVRFDLVRAIVERHTLRIDMYVSNTGDMAEVDGHFYADKAPGASLTAVPFVAVTRAALGAFGRDVYSAEAIAGLSYVATVAAAGAPVAVAALCIFLIARRLGFGDGASAVAAIVCGLGTPLWAYGTLLYGHALAAGCLVAALWAAMAVTDGGGAAFKVRLGLLLGICAGWAVVTEFPSAVPSALIVGFVGWRAWNEDRQTFAALALAMFAGAGLCAAALLTYNSLAFGSPLAVSYSSEAGQFEGMRRGLFGVSWPSWRVAGALLIGKWRGLLPLAPVLIVAPIGFWLLVKDTAARGVAALAAVIVAFYFLLTSGYAYWNGGWSYGSRHLGPALPFMCLGVAAVWQRGGRLVRVVVLALALVSVGQTLVAVATTPQPDGGASGPKDPMRELLWPAFVSGDFPIGWQSVLEKDAPRAPLSELEREGVPRASWNVGQKMGLRGHASLLPLLAIWIAGIGVWRVAGRST